MASHGVPRTSTQNEKSEQAKEKEQRKIQEYKQLVEAVSERIAARDLTYETLELTSKLLKKNPEYYTMWNNRRRVLRALFTEQLAVNVAEGKTVESIEEIISSELEFILPLLMKFPKCYWIWNHRLWLLQQTEMYLSRQASLKFWQRELGLVAKMLTRDNRNFHGWDYRRRIIAALRGLDGDEGDESTAGQPSLTEQEFAYTTKMVRSNLSNFSAWHNRCKLIPRLLDERAADHEARRKLFVEELQFINDALSVDPFDQSLWYYHRFLMSNMMAEETGCFGKFSGAERLGKLGEQTELFREVLEDYEDCKWIYQNLLYFAEESLQVSSDVDFVEQSEMRKWLEQLKRLDPLRTGRWAAWEKRLPVAS